MNIVHTGDIHLDSPMSTYLSSKVSIKRRDELLDSFEKMVKKSKELNCRVIIIAGDMFDVKKPTQKTIRNLKRIIDDYPDIDFLYCEGNHDNSDFVSLFDRIPDNLKLFSDKWKTYSYDGIDITGINFNSKTQNYLYDTLVLDKSKQNIVVLHGETTLYNDSSKIQLKRLQNKGIDYLALGHIHQNSVSTLDDRGIVVYCGCLEGRGFDEEGKKGFYYLNTDNIKRPVFIANSSRIVHKIEIDVSNYPSWYELMKELNKKLEAITRRDIVEVILKGKYNLDFDKRVEKLEQTLDEQFFFGKVKDITNLKIEISDFSNAISLKTEFIKMVQNSNITEEEKEKVIEYGIKALMGEL